MEKHIFVPLKMIFEWWGFSTYVTILEVDITCNGIYTDDGDNNSNPIP